MTKIKIGLGALLLALTTSPVLAQDISGDRLSREERIERFFATRGADLSEDQRARLLDRLANRQDRPGARGENLTDEQRARIQERFTALRERRGGVGLGPDRREDVFDRRENRFDRREDRRDARFDLGPRDRIEDRFDRREDRFDRRENRVDRRTGPRQGRFNGPRRRARN